MSQESKQSPILSKRIGNFITTKKQREANKRRAASKKNKPAGYEHLTEATCQECKQDFLISRELIAPFYFSDYKRSFWLCRGCKDAVHERYRNRNKKQPKLI